MNKISDLQIRIGADASGLKRELNEAQNALKTALNTKPIDDASNKLGEISKQTGTLIGGFQKMAVAAGGAFGLGELISSAVQAGDAIYTLSSRLGVSASEAGQLSRVLKLTGGDVNSAATAIMRLDKTFSSAGSAGNKARETLKNYGVSLTDASGKLLPLNQQLENLAGGYKEAKKNGQEQAFLMDTLGVKGMALAQTLDQYTDAARAASKVQGVGLDPKEMHELSQQMKVMQMETSQVKLAFVAALAPVAQDIFPQIISGLTKTAKFLAENKTQVREITKNVVTFLAIYKGVQLAQTAINGGRNILGSLSAVINAEKIAQEKAAAETAAKQEAMIAKQVATVERSYDAQRKAAIRAATRMNLSAEETAKIIAEKLTEIEVKSTETAERVASSMRAGFAQAAQAATATSGEMNAALAGTGTAAEASAVRVNQAHVTEAESAQVAATAERELAVAETATGEAAAVAGGRSVAAKTEAAAATAQATMAEQGLTAATTTAGATAATAGTRAVTAANAATVATERTTVASKGLTVATATSGIRAVEAGTKTVSAASVARSGVVRLTSAVWALAGGWVGVGAAIAYASYCLYQYRQGKLAEKKSNEFEQDGKTYRWNKDQGTWEEKSAGVNTNIAVVNASYGNTAGINAFASDAFLDNGSTWQTVTDEDVISGLQDQWWERHKDDKDYVAQLQQEAADEEIKKAEEEAKRLGEQIGNISAGGGGSGGGGADMSAAAAQPTVPMRTKYSFEDDPELAPWANEIIYAGNYHGTDPALIAAIIKAESHGQSDVWSSDHAHWGLGQISQDVANAYGSGRGYGEGSDPNENIMAVAGYLRALLDQYGNSVPSAISAYNLGHADVNANPEYVSTVQGYYSSISTSQVPAGEGTQPQLTTVETPIGVSMYDEAAKNTGEQLGASTCAHFVSYLARGIGANTGVISDLVKDWVDTAQQNGAWVDASSGQTAPKGSLVVWSDGSAGNPWAHIGISDGAGGWIASDNHGVKHSTGLDSYYAGNGYTYAGYIDMDRLTGGQTIKRTVDASQKAADEAARRVKQATDEANKMLAELRAENAKESGYAYQRDYAKLMSDIADKASKIRKLQSQGAPSSSIEALKKELSEYSTTTIEKFREKWKEAYDELKNSSASALASMHHNYEKEADLEYEATVKKLEKELEEKKKALMRDENDYETRNRLEDKYYAQVEEAEDKRRKAREEAHEKYVSYLEEEGNLAMLVQYMGQSRRSADGTLSKSEGEKRGERSINLQGEKALAKEYVKLWKTAHGSMAEYIADVSDGIYSSLAESMADFVRGTKSAKSVLQDFGNSVLQMMAKIAAQRLASTWMSNILGAFGTRGGSSAAWTWGGTTHDSSFGISSSFTTSKWTAPSANILNVPKFASGGIVTAPTLAMIGEGGNHEAVIPLTDTVLRTMSGSGRGGGVVVNITNKSDSKVSVANSSYNEDVGKYILDVVVDGATRDRGGFGRNLKAALGAK